MPAHPSPFTTVLTLLHELFSGYGLLVLCVVLAVFAVLFWFGRGQRGDAELPGVLPQPDPLQKTILVVDDSAVVRAKLEKLLRQAGYRVLCAEDGVQALACLAEQFVSVLITDLEMPRMDGLELIAAVQGSLESEDVPIIAITGHEALHARVQDYQGLFGIFKKPWNDRELLKRLATLAVLRAAR